MKVAELMFTELETVTAVATVATAILALADAHVYGLPVLEERTLRLIGVLSTSDILRATAECASAEERERLFDDTSVRDIMTSNPATTTPYEDVREVAQQMLYLDVHRLFVVDGNDLVGVISQSDIVRAVATAKI
jgi:CBS domain-containing protein